MNIRIEVTAVGTDWRVHITAPDEAEFAPIYREGHSDKAGYPLAPDGESTSWTVPFAMLCSGADPSGREAASDQFLLTGPRPGQPDVKALGGYLFSVLLGGAWGAIAERAVGEPVGLQLALPDIPIWHQLPWELMIGPDGPLVAFGKTIAITRLVTPANPAPSQLSIDIPIRVLFVIGRELDDQLRPGAEYLGLLRHLQVELGGPANAVGIALHTRLLLEATTADVETAVREFQPNVVHFICHGQLSDSGSVLILTRYEASVRRDPKPDPVKADRLAALLLSTDPAHRPHAVVVNACNTARIDSQSSFARDLVQLGIPMVVGMSGEVADAACRLFTKRFYAALVDQRPIDLAAAEGRRAALLHFKNFDQNFDWGRPVFCQAEGVRPQFKQQTRRQVAIAVAENLRPKQRREPFCGRLPWLPVFRDVLARRIKNLAIESAEEIVSDPVDATQLGKTRLLEELAWLSVLEGWIPLRLTVNRPRYASLLPWAVDLFATMEKARDEFGVPRREASHVVREACAALGVPYATGYGFPTARDQVLVKLEPQHKSPITPDNLQTRLRLDCEELRRDISTVVGARAGVLILWDQLDREEGLEREIVNLIGPAGLGTAAAPVPVVCTYSVRTPSGKRLLTANNENSNIERRNLQRYDTLEAGLACRQFLTWKKLVPSRAWPAQVDTSILTLAGQVNGYPSRLHHCEQAIKVLTDLGIWLQFDDALIMSQYR